MTGLYAMLWRAALNLEPHGTWPIGRFRDLWLEQDSQGRPIVAVYTRNGGGNRNHWDFTYPDQQEGEGCDCPGCIIQYRIRKHPLYITDYDNDFDSTYATILFRVPDPLKEIAGADLAAGGPGLSGDKRWAETLERLRAGDPELIEKGRPLIEAIANWIEDRAPADPERPAWNTSPVDRLSEIKGALAGDVGPCFDNPDDQIIADLRWLVAEVERLRE